FNITILDDTRIDGPQTAIVRAHVNNWFDGASFITVRDNESTNLSVTVPSQLNEAAGVLPHDGSVAIDGTLLTNLTVSLNSSDPTRLAVRASVTILAGETNAPFDLILINNNLIDGAEVVTVTAHAARFGEA